MMYVDAVCKGIDDIPTVDADTRQLMLHKYETEGLERLCAELKPVSYTHLVDNILVSSTIGRNKLLIPGEVISAIINGTDELLAELREMGVGVYATGGETADVGDLVRTIIVDSTVTCRMKRDVYKRQLWHRGQRSDSLHRPRHLPFRLRGRRRSL